MHCSSFVIVFAVKERLLRVDLSSKRRHRPARVPYDDVFLCVVIFVTGAACAC
jgi:hypothetical protein